MKLCVGKAGSPPSVTAHKEKRLPVLASHPLLPFPNHHAPSGPSPGNLALLEVTIMDGSHWLSSIDRSGF